MKRLVLILLIAVFIFNCKAVDESKVIDKSKVESKDVKAAAESSVSVTNKLPFEITSLEASWVAINGYFYLPEVSFYVKNISNLRFSNHPRFKVRFTDDNGIMKGSLGADDAYGLLPGMIKGPIKIRSGSEVTFIEPSEFKRLTTGLKTFWSYNLFVDGLEFEVKGRLNVPK